MPFLLIVIIAIALIIDFLDGLHDSSNIVATMISSRAMSPRAALGISAAAHLAGPFLFGVAVATTIGSEMVDPAAINSTVVIATLISAILWNLITWYFGWPSSTSHALIGGSIGAVAAAAGVETIHLAMLRLKEMRKPREVYRHLSNCADRGDAAANTVHDIVVAIIRRL